jgi:trans-aconitate methyltransferase
MLPEDTKKRRAVMVEETLRQSQVNEHFEKAKPEDKPKVYTDEIFNEAAIQWLIETDQVSIVTVSCLHTNHASQPIQAFEHPAFKNMIDIAARATRGVKLLSRKQMRREIMRMFKEQMTGLKERLNVCIVYECLC